MAKTIIQTIGPLYGEIVNGTVFGRPNGSIYVPATNVIHLTGTDKIKNSLVSGNHRVRFVNDDGTTSPCVIVAESQDVASNIEIILASDAELSTVLATNSYPAGTFNISTSNIIRDYELTAEETYYVGAVLMNNNTPVAVDILEVTAV